MRRIVLASALAVAFGLGVMSGIMLPAAVGEPEVTATQVQTVTPPPPPLIIPPTSVVTYTGGRWQLLTVPAPDGARVLTLLLDTNTGISYVLAPRTGVAPGYRWERVDRTL